MFLLLPLLALLPLVSAAPYARAAVATTRAFSMWDVNKIQQIAPESSSCDGAQFADECATASRATAAIINSFTKYQVTNANEQAALIALMVYESGSFRYNKNHYPGRPGQGTRNMQSPDYNKAYAQEVIPQDQVQAAQGDVTKTLDLVLPDEFSFASAAWFLTKYCSADVRAGLQQGTLAGWHAYLQSCIVTDLADARDVVYNKVMTYVAKQ